MNRRTLCFVSGIVVLAILVLGLRPIQAQTPGRIAQFGPGIGNCNFAAGNDCIDSVITQDAAGNIGIGTTAPAQSLDVNGVIRTSGAFPNFQGISNVNLVSEGDNTGNVGFWTTTGALVRQRMLIDNSGKVGIGTTAPANILTVVQGGGNVLADGYSTYSSRRWKTSIRPLTDALTKVSQLQGVSFDRNTDGKRDIGFLAEDVGHVVPEIVTYERNGKDAQSVDYSRLTPLLVEAVKEQQAEIRMLRNELKALRSQVGR